MISLSALENRNLDLFHLYKVHVTLLFHFPFPCFYLKGWLAGTAPVATQSPLPLRQADSQTDLQ